MKAKVYFFRVIIGITAFILGFGVWGFCEIKNNIKPTAECFTPDNPENRISPEFFQQIEESVEGAVRQEYEQKYEFVPDGTYYVIEKLPKNLKGLDMISIEAFDWASETSDIPTKPIILKGFVRAGIEYKFAKINIHNRLISFETEEKNGIHFTFIGNFPNDSGIYADWQPDLEGELKKYKNGKVIAKMKLGFDLLGC